MHETKAKIELIDLPAPKDLLEDFNNNETLVETEQPLGLRTRLGRYVDPCFSWKRADKMQGYRSSFKWRLYYQTFIEA